MFRERIYFAARIDFAERNFYTALQAGLALFIQSYGIYLRKKKNCKLDFPNNRQYHYHILHQFHCGHFKFFFFLSFLFFFSCGFICLFVCLFVVFGGVCLFVLVVGFFLFLGGVHFEGFCVKKKRNVLSMVGCVIVANQDSIRGYEHL